MRKILALIRADGLTTASYRLRTLVWVCSMVVTIVPLYFVAQALQPTMTNAIATEGRQYFAFLVVGTVALLVLATAVNTLPEAVQAGISRGTLEALLATPTSLPVLFGGLMGFPVLLTLARGGIVLVAAWALGAHVVWVRLVPAVAILLLILAAHVPFAILGASLVLAFKTSGSFPSAVLTASALLGGAYYPTRVIPSWLHGASTVLPLTYGLRALRRTLIDPMPLQTILPDVAILAALGIGLLAISLLAFAWAMRYARQAGTLAQY
ncbi:MAG TPA: ABC transporter permease [Gemmatimonadales bacterium]|nr:ABC transporter permease [Gemmatimonadales bacterium]